MADDRPAADSDTSGSDATDPDAAGGDDSPEDAGAANAPASSSGSDPGASAGPDRNERTFDWRNWLLVAAIVVSFVAIPLAILLRPFRVNSFVFTYLVLPLVPAFLLGGLAVWAATR